MEFCYRFLRGMDGLVVIRLIDIVCRIDIIRGIVVRRVMNIVRITVHTTYDGRIVLDMYIAHNNYTLLYITPTQKEHRSQDTGACLEQCE